MIVARAAHLCHRYRDAGTEIVALDDVSLDVQAGELLLVVGPSGSGKSTLLCALAGLLAPTSGQVDLAGVALAPLDAEGRARARRDHLGFVFQSFHLFAALTARENVECVLEMKGVPRREQRARAEAALARVGLEQRMKHRPAQLSGGERQRVAVARALAVEPAIIFGDEPTSALDAGSAGLVIDVLQRFVGEGGSVVLATHDARLHAIATRIVALDQGRLCNPSSPAIE